MMELTKVEVIIDDENGVGNKFIWVYKDLLLETIVFNIDNWDDDLLAKTIQDAIKMFQDYYRQKHKKNTNTERIYWCING